MTLLRSVRPNLSHILSFFSEAQREGIPITSSLIWLFSRTMKLVEETRTNSKYGTRDAAAARKPTLKEPTLKFRVIDIFLGVMFSGTHNMYRRRLMKTKFNNVLYLPDFRELLHELIIEWGGMCRLTASFEDPTDRISADRLKSSSGYFVVITI